MQLRGSGWPIGLRWTTSGSCGGVVGLLLLSLRLRTRAFGGIAVAAVLRGTRLSVCRQTSFALASSIVTVELAHLKSAEGVGQMWRIVMK
jgi:hypothetical protein